MLTIVLSPPTTDPHPCPCCGGVSTRLTRLVYRDGIEYAAYYAAFTPKHPQGYVSVLVSLGDWAEDAPPSKRCAFYICIRSNADKGEVMVRDAADSPWGKVPVFGRPLSRDEALAHPRIKEVFDISDHIVVADEPIIDHLLQSPENA